MSIMQAEVGIVGAGPAGARAAELLANAGAEVLLLDPKAPWEKPCGGGITAGTFLEFPALRDATARSRQMTKIRLESPEASIRLELGAPLTVVARTELARWQLDRATSAGVTLLQTRVRAVGRLDERWRLHTDGGDEVSVRRLVGADGAASLVRRAVRPSFRPRLAPTRVAYPSLADHEAGEALFRFVPDLDGYVWDFPRTDHRSVGVGVSGAKASRVGMDAAVDGYWTRRHGGSLDGTRRTGAVIGTAGDAHSYADVGDVDWALLGDAAGFADPVTGEGIRNALRSAACLVDAYRADRSFASYPARAEATFEGEFRVSRRIHALLYDGRLAARLVEAATWNRVTGALAAAVSNGGNEHELWGTLLARWRAAYHGARAA